MQTLATTIQFSRLSKLGWQSLVCAAFAGMLLTPSIAASDSPPKLNVGPSCEAAARGAIAAGRNKETCMADERASQDVVNQNWSKYAPADKTQCVGMNMTGGPSSYVELLSCLEIMRDAKVIRSEDLLAEPLLNNGKVNTRTLVPTDLDEASLYTGDGTKVRRRHKRNHRG
jgi:hypothetical protein